MTPNRFAALALVLVLVGVFSASATHAPPGFTLTTDAAAKRADFATSIGTLQGVASDGSSYYVSATAALAKYDASGTRAWLTDTSADGSQGGAAQTDVTYHAGNLYVGHKTSSTGYIATYSAASGSFQGEVSLGAGTPSAITYAHGAFWIIWTVDGTTYEVQERNDALQLVASYPLPRTYDLDTGPQGAAWVDAALLLPRHANNGDAHGVDVFRFTPTHAAPAFSFVHTLPYVAWTSPAGRAEVSSQGLDVLRDHDGYSLVVAGREAATGNGGGTGGVLHVGLTVTRSEPYSSLITVAAPSAKYPVTNGTLQGVTNDASGLFVTTPDTLLRLDSSGAVAASRDTRNDGAASQNGDLTVLGDRVFVHTSDYPAMPRQAYIAAYNSTTLAFIEEKPLGNRDGAGGGVAAWNGSLWAPVNRDLGGDLALRHIDPATLAVVDEYELGHHGSISPQGIAILAGHAFIPHGNKDSLDSLDGWLIYEWTGATWTPEGSLAYPNWTGTDGKVRIASQGIDFDVAQDCTVTAWTVGRFIDGHGHGAGDVARHTVSPGTLDVCPDDPDDPDDPPGDEDPPGGGGVDTASSPWLLGGLGAAALLVLALAAWRIRNTSPAPDAPSGRALLIGSALAIALTLAALAAWPNLPTLWT